MRFNDESVTSRLAGVIRKAFADKDDKGLNTALTEMETLPLKTKDDGIAIHLHSGGPSGSTVTTGGSGNADEAPDEEEKKAVAAKDAEYQSFQKEMRDGMKAMMDAITALATPATASGNDADPDIEEEKPEGTNDSVMAAKDSALLAESFQQLAAGAEILVPGIFVPAFDEAAAPKKTYDSMTALRGQVLQFFAATPAGSGLLPVLHGKAVDFAKLSTKDARTLFNSAVQIQKERNNNARSTDAGAAAAVVAAQAQGQGGGRIQTVAQLNEANRKFYAADKAA